MTASYLLYNDFTKGEISPKAYSRVDGELYTTALETMKNFTCAIEGGARRRTGTWWAGETKNSTASTFLEFSFSTDGQAYVIEVGDYYFRFWSSGSQVESSGVPVEVTTPYTAAEAAELQYVQVGNVIYLAHQSHAPRQLIRVDNTTWTLDEITFVDGPYLPLNDTSTDVYSSADLIIDTTTTLTFSATNGVNDGIGFQASDVGRLIRVKATGGAALWIYGTIQAVTSTTVVDVLWARVGAGITDDDDTDTAGTLLVGAKTTSWRLGAFSALTGYPKCVEIFESRIVWANTSYEPRTLYFSRSQIPLDYAPSHGDSTVVAEHGFSPAILSGKGDEILWLKEAPRLQIGTAAGVRTMGGSDTKTSIAPDNISQRLELPTGSADVVPESAQTATLFVGRDGKALHNAYYSFEQNGLVGPNISAVHSHLFRAGIKKLAFAHVPDSIVWVIDENGALYGITYDRDNRIAGFHRHDIGGTNVVIKDIAVIPSGVDSNDTRDSLWLLLQRTINGATKTYIEILTEDFEDQDAEDAIFLDCARSSVFDAGGVITGFDHLEGETVSILANGVVMPDQVVSGGTITLPANWTIIGIPLRTVTVGFRYASELITLRPPLEIQDGRILTRKQKIWDVHTDVIDTFGLFVGAKGRTLETATKRQVSDDYGNPPALQTDTVRTLIDDSWSGAGQLRYFMDDPLPAFIRSSVIGLQTESGVSG